MTAAPCLSSGVAPSVQSVSSSGVLFFSAACRSPKRGWPRTDSQTMPAEAMEMPQGDLRHPDLRIGYSLPQPFGCLHLILVQFAFARLDVDRDELRLNGRCTIGSNLALDERVP